MNGLLPGAARPSSFTTSASTRSPVIAVPNERRGRDEQVAVGDGLVGDQEPEAVGVAAEHALHLVAGGGELDVPAVAGDLPGFDELVEGLLEGGTVLLVHAERLGDGVGGLRLVSLVGDEGEDAGTEA